MPWEKGCPECMSVLVVRTAQKGGYRCDGCGARFDTPRDRREVEVPRHPRNRKQARWGKEVVHG